ncbi:MAG: nucleoside triphosphate pyrophosphohydrolase [Verrucomicrobiota bacterium]|nr:nucleoside triphosphate pyrophosphohydrolase [Verrucomicrobiota bacterium]
MSSAKQRRTGESGGRVMDRLLAIVARLRGKGGCPWDRKQTLRTLMPQLLEECYELMEAVASGNRSHHEEELGDLLLQIVLQAQIRGEQGAFSFDDVARRVADKLVRRHPHVFGGPKVKSARQALKNWEAIKAAEKKDADRSVLDGIPRRLPALLRAHCIQSRVARVGFDWKKTEDVMRKVREEVGELSRAIARGRPAEVREEIGDLLFALVNLSRFRGLDAEDTLQRANAKFARRFQEVERRLRAKRKEPRRCTLAEMDAEWERVKRVKKVSSVSPSAG